MAFSSYILAHDYKANNKGEAKYYSPLEKRDVSLYLHLGEDGQVSGSMWMDISSFTSSKKLKNEKLKEILKLASKHLSKQLLFYSKKQLIKVNIDFPILKASKHFSHHSYEKVTFSFSINAPSDLIFKTPKTFHRALLAINQNNKITFVQLKVEEKSLALKIP